MAFEWEEDVDVGDPIDKDDQGEIKGNIDSLADEFGVGLSWTYFSDEDDKPIEDYIYNEHPKELREKTETIDDNKETADYNDYDSSVQGSNNDNYDGTDDRSQNYGENSSYNSTNYSNEDEHDSDYDYSENTIYNSGTESHYDGFQSNVNDWN